MRRMAGFATLHADRGMFKQKRPALIGVTVQACFFGRVRLGHHARPHAHFPSGCLRSMRIVTIGALHETLIDAVLERHVELRPHIVVARVAEIGLSLREQELRRRRAVNRVAAGADDVVQGVGRSPDISAAHVLGMAGEAIVQDFARRHDRERVRDRELATPCFHVCLARAMATLAAGPLGWFLARRDALVVRIFIEIRPDIRVACLADFAADIRGC